MGLRWGRGRAEERAPQQPSGQRPEGLTHGRDVAEAMGRGSGTTQAGRGVVLGVAWRSGIAGHLADGLCRGTEQGRVRREEREKGERRADRWAPPSCGVHVSKTTLKTTRMAKCDRF